MTMSALNQHTSSLINVETFRQLGIRKALPYLVPNRQPKTLLLWIIFAALIKANLIGCLWLPVPAPTVLEKPFQGESAGSIKVGITTKDEVEIVLGRPDATRGNGSIYIYAKPYIYMKFLLLDLNPLGQGHMRDFQTSHLIFVQFDINGIVKDIDHITGNDSKTQTGIYVADTGLRSKVTKLYGPVYTPPYAPVDQMLVLYSPSDKDANAKQFLIPTGKSAIYVYCEPDYLGWFLPENAIAKWAVGLDQTYLGGFGTKGFFYWVVDPGRHLMTVKSIFPLPHLYISDVLTIECTEDQIVFVELTWEDKVFTGKVFSHLNIISDSNKGREEILKRRMILDSLTSID